MPLSKSRLPPKKFEEAEDVSSDLSVTAEAAAAAGLFMYSDGE